MPQPTSNQRPPGFLMALWFSFIGFIGSLFKKSPSAAPLPIPVTTRPPKVKPNTTFTRPTSASVRVTHQRISMPFNARVKEASPLKRPSSAASSPISSTARTTPGCRSRSATPKRPLTDPKHIFHPPASPFPNISLSGIFATPPLLSSPHLASDIELGPLSLASPPQVQTLTPIVPPSTPSPFRGSHGASSPLFHSLHSSSLRTPSSAVIVQLDRSTISPTTMSDGSLEVISLGDRRGFVGSPVKVADVARLPSPWSPIGKTASSDVWMSVDGILMDASGPIADMLAHSESQDDSLAFRTVTLSPSRSPTTSLYSSSPAFEALGITVFVNLDQMGDQGNNANAGDDLKLNQVRDGDRSILVTREPQTPRKRRDTLPCVTPHTNSHSARATKCLSTPLTKLDNAELHQVRSTTSISSMAYELRLGLFADGRSISAFENIISLLDQASPESVTPQYVVAG